MQVKTKNIEGLKRQADKLLNIKISTQTYQTLYAITLKDTVEKYMEGLLGPSDMKHFKVTVSGHGPSSRVSVSAIDEVGVFIYEGTKPHKITLNNGAAIPFYGMFANSVDHPGIASKKDEINGVVAEAIDDVKAIMRGRVSV